MTPRSAKRREEAATQLEEAGRLATDAGMTLRPLSYASGDANDVTQYRLTGPGGAWYKDVYPGARRIYCPERAKQGPFVGMPKERSWSLTDFVRACIKAHHAASKQGGRPAEPGEEAVAITGDATDNRVVLKKMIDKISVLEGTETQQAFRDLMTDIRHLADFMKLDMDAALTGSYLVYLEEKDDPEFAVFGSN